MIPIQPVRTVGDLIAALRELDPAVPVGCVVYQPGGAAVGNVLVFSRVMRRQHPGLDHATDAPHWFELGSRPAAYHEERGGVLETVVVIRGA